MLIGGLLLSLYPVLVKTTNTSLSVQVLSRLLVTVAVSYFLLTIPVSSAVTPAYIMVSLLYLAHIYTSYIGFRSLDVGVALTLFYIYPLLNLLLSGRMTLAVVPYYVACLLGVLLISIGVNRSQPAKTSGSFAWGVFAIGLAALTESLIYIFYKSYQRETNPFNMLFTLCLVGALVMTAGFFTGYFPSTMPVDRPTLWKLIGANLLLGVIGYAMRFYGLPLLSVEWYSILSFVNVIFGYLVGHYFLGEPITGWHVAGTALILTSVSRITV